MYAVDRKPFQVPLHAGDMLTIENEEGEQIIFDIGRKPIGPNQGQFWASVSLPPGYRVFAVDHAGRRPAPPPAPPPPPKVRPAHDPRQATAARRMAVKMMHADYHLPSAVRELCRRAIGVVDELRAMRAGEGRVESELSEAGGRT